MGNILKTNQDLEKSSIISRRTFLKTSVIGTSSLIFSYSKISFSSTFLSQQLMVGRFSVNVGAQVVATSISNYVLSNKINPELSSEIDKTNNQLASNGFTDFTDSKVYSVGNEFFYSIKNGDGLNTTTPFFSKGRKPRKIVVVEGPGMVCLAKASEEMRNKKWTINEVHKALMPKYYIQDSIGSFQHGYENKERYSTDTGRVDIDYANKGKGKGVVAIVVSRKLEKGWVPFFSKAYDLEYIF